MVNVTQRRLLIIFLLCCCCFSSGCRGLFGRRPRSGPGLSGGANMGSGFGDSGGPVGAGGDFPGGEAGLGDYKPPGDQALGTSPGGANDPANPPGTPAPNPQNGGATGTPGDTGKPPDSQAHDADGSSPAPAPGNLGPGRDAERGSSADATHDDDAVPPSAAGNHGDADERTDSAEDTTPDSRAARSASRGRGSESETAPKRRSGGESARAGEDDDPPRTGSLLERLIALKPKEFAYRGLKSNEGLERAVTEGKANPFQMGYTLSAAVQGRFHRGNVQGFYLGSPQGKLGVTPEPQSEKGKPLTVEDIDLPESLRPTDAQRFREAHRGDGALALVKEWVNQTNGLVVALEADKRDQGSHSRAQHDTGETRAGVRALEGLVEALAVGAAASDDNKAQSALLAVIRENGRRAWQAAQAATESGGTRFNPSGIEAYARKVRDEAPAALGAFVRRHFGDEPWAAAMFRVTPGREERAAERARAADTDAETDTDTPRARRAGSETTRPEATDAAAARERLRELLTRARRAAAADHATEE